MPYDATVGEPAIRVIDGVRYITITIVETEAGSEDGFSVPIPTPSTLWLYEAWVEHDSGGDPTVDPEVGLEDGFTDAVWSNGTAATVIREQPDARIPVLPSGAELHVHSGASATADQVTTRVTFREG